MFIPFALVSPIAAIGTAVVPLLLTIEVAPLPLMPAVLNSENADAVLELTAEVMVLLDRLKVPSETIGTIRLELPLVFMVMLFEPAIFV